MTGTIQAALTAAAARLAALDLPDPARDSRLLMAQALGISPDRLTLVSRDALTAPAARTFETLLQARETRQPVAQILGRRAFWGRDFIVTPDVLDPRPETETLIAAALGGTAPTRILDLGTGSGAILLTLLAEYPKATGLGTDISAPALRIAAANATRHGLTPRASFLRTDWAQGITGCFDLITSNPPYIPEADVAHLALDVRDWEPRGALTAGPTGLEAYRRIATDLRRMLSPGGRALFEFGAGQGPDVAAVFAAAGFADCTLHADLDGRPRVAELR